MRQQVRFFPIIYHHYPASLGLKLTWPCNSCRQYLAVHCMVSLVQDNQVNEDCKDCSIEGLWQRLYRTTWWHFRGKASPRPISYKVSRSRTHHQIVNLKRRSRVPWNGGCGMNATRKHVLWSSSPSLKLVTIDCKRDLAPARFTLRGSHAQTQPACWWTTTIKCPFSVQWISIIFQASFQCVNLNHIV